MDQDKFEKYLTDRYEDQIKWYSAKASTNKQRFQYFQWMVIILAAVTPVLVTAGKANLPKGWGNWIFGTTVVVSILLAIGTAGIKAFKFQENWTNYRATAERLIQEKYYYDGNVGEYGETENRETLFVKRVEAIFSGEGSQWISVQKTNV